MDSVIESYHTHLHKGCPALARSFSQIVDIRTGRSEQNHYLDFGLADEELSKRVNTAINKQKRLSIPQSWCPLGLPASNLQKYSGDTCITHRSLVDLLPNLTWYDPAFPERGGWVFAGSAARPSMEHDEYRLECTKFKASALGVMEEHVTNVSVFLPTGAKDIDLFLVVGGTDEKVREMVGRTHVDDIMADSADNPLNELMNTGGACRGCGLTNRRTYYGHCVKCIRTNVKCKPYTYSAKHVVAYTLPGGLDIQFVTRVYRDVDLIVPRFDMTLDGAIFAPKMGLRVLPIALQEWRNGIMLLTPFSGSNTMNERIYKKMHRYNVVPVLPGYVEDLHSRGVVYAITVARTIKPGMTWRTAVRECKKLPIEQRKSVIALYHQNMSTMGLLKRVTLLAHLEKQMMDDEDEVGAIQEYAFSKSSECASFAVRNSNVVILTDLQESTGSSGSFQALTTEETMAKLDITYTTTNTPPLVAQTEAVAEGQLEASVIIPSGEMDEIIANKAKRGLRVFAGPPLQQIINNLIVNKELLQVTGLNFVLIGVTDDPCTLKIAIVGGNFLTDQQDVAGAQVWTVHIRKISEAPVLKCITETGLYHRNQPVCMGAQSHFHEREDPLATGILFSLPALIVSISDRAKLIMNEDPEHLTSIGVKHPTESVEYVLKSHNDAYVELNNHDGNWIYKIEL